MNSQILNKVLKLKNLYDTKQIPTLAIHEVHPNLDPSDRLNYLYFTLPVSINFQRSSPAMWPAALKTFEDSATNYLFYPEKVVQKNLEDIKDDLFKYRLSLQRNKHAEIWYKLCVTFNKYFNNDPREVIIKSGNTVKGIKDLIQINQKKDFPYLSGAKLANYWIYILSQYTHLSLEDMHEISIIPDTHVLQASVVLGLTDKIETPEVAERLWFELLKDSSLTPVQMHPVLWNWSRNGFKPEI
jgi:hypothetical protein